MLARAAPAGSAAGRSSCRRRAALPRPPPRGPLGRAIHNYYSANGCFPPAYIADKNRRPMHSWRVLLLPYLGENRLYGMYHFDEPWDGPSNRALADRMPAVVRRLRHGDCGLPTGDACRVLNRARIWTPTALSAPAACGTCRLEPGVCPRAYESWPLTLLSTRQIARLTHSLVSLVWALSTSLPLTYVAFHRPSFS
jgi:hypothetical protein